MTLRRKRPRYICYDFGFFLLFFFFFPLCEHVQYGSVRLRLLLEQARQIKEGAAVFEEDFDVFEASGDAKQKVVVAPVPHGGGGKDHP